MGSIPASLSNKRWIARLPVCADVGMGNCHLLSFGPLTDSYLLAISIDDENE